MESTLSLKKEDFEKKLGLYFGHGMDPETWSDEEEYKIRDCVESGLRQFYFPPPLGGSPYDWSFLKPTVSLTIASADSATALPDDFGGFEGKITISSPTNQYRSAVELVNEGIIRELFAKNPSRTGAPEAVSLRPIKGATLTQGQRFELYGFPTTDQAYTVEFSYYILANYLDGTHPYAYGGMAHAETILESCLAIAEQRYDNTAGIHSAKFLERLAASIALDRRLKPQTGGRNTDESDRLMYRHSVRTLCTYNGVSMG